MVVEGQTKTPAMLTLLLQKLATFFGEPTRSRSVLSVRSLRMLLVIQAFITLIQADMELLGKGELC